MGVTPRLTYIFYQGSGTSTQVPAIMAGAINGRAFQIGLDEYERSTIAQLRQANDDSTEPGEKSFNPEGLWKRARSDWSLGAGQRHADREDSNRRRFWSSEGVDVWEREELSLLPETQRILTSAATNLELLAVGAYLYVVDGQELKHTTDPTVAPATFTSSDIHGADGAVDVQSITTDGATVWAALGASGIHKTTVGASSSTANWSTFTADFVGFANGRLLAADGAQIREIANDGTFAATLNFTHWSTGFAWTHFLSTPSAILAVGTNGDRSEIYAITVDEADGSLNVPVYAGATNDGETIKSIAFYGGSLIVGTSRGLRVGQIQSERVFLFAVIEIGSVQALEPQAEFVWFGWTNYSATKTGLGRANLAEFADQDRLAPAYASDLMAITQGAVLSAATFGDRRYFAVSGSGVWGQHTNVVAEGHLWTGWVSHGTTERKISVSGDVRHQPLDGTVSLSIRANSDTADTELLGISETADSLGPESRWAARRQGAEKVDIKLTLARSATDATSRPVVEWWALRSLPAAARNDEFLVPIIVNDKVATWQGEGRSVPYDTLEFFQWLKELEAAGAPVTYQEGASSYTVRIDRVLLRHPDGWNNKKTFFSGRVYTRLVTADV